MKSSPISLAHKSIAAGVLEIFAEVTRYPVEILDPSASLEEDLGIDSVKLGEVFAVLREKYDLPMEIGIPPERMKTIGGITGALEVYLQSSQPEPVQPVAQPQVIAVPPAPVSNGNSTLDRAALNQGVLDVFAEVTRYPAEILDPEAGLEEDLGVDSVKLGEVFAVLREKYDLPLKIGIPPEEMKTIGGISNALYTYLTGNVTAAVLETPAEILATSIPTVAPVANGNGHAIPATPNHSLHSADITQGVLDVFAEVTRYPAEILDPAASLEEDLGIDSVKLGEVFAVLREKYDLPLKIGIPPEQMKTIGGITTALITYLNTSTGSPVTPATAPVGLNPSSNGSSNGIQSAPAQPVSAPSRKAAQPASATGYAPHRPEQQPLKDKVVFISGSGRGLGKDIAVYLSELGANVILNSFHSRIKGEETAAEIKAGGGQAHHIWGSMANPTHVDNIFNEIEAKYGKLDFFISNASNGMLAKLEDITAEHWEKAFRTNIIGLHQGAQRSLELMKKNGGGKIITLSSPASSGYVDYFGCMGAVKAAVESLTRSMAIEFAPHNVSVNCVSPGPIYGELLKKWPESERLIKQWEDNTAYERLCEPRDVSHFIGYLLSDPVKIFTGSVLVMDGGISSQGW